MLNLNLMALITESRGGGGTCNVRIYLMERERGHLNWIFMAKLTKLTNPNVQLHIG
jgi:hypothetical protein